MVGRDGFRFWVLALALALAFWMAGGVADVLEVLGGRLLGEGWALMEALVQVDIAEGVKWPGGRPGKR